jgi:hypothetical protein
LVSQPFLWQTISTTGSGAWTNITT